MNCSKTIFSILFHSKLVEYFHNWLEFTRKKGVLVTAKATSFICASSYVTHITNSLNEAKAASMVFALPRQHYFAWHCLWHNVLLLPYAVCGTTTTLAIASMGSVPTPTTRRKKRMMGKIMIPPLQPCLWFLRA